MSSDVFSALADPTRRRIVEMLAGTDGMSASEIYDRFEVSPQAVSQHLKILREANLAQVEKRAQQRIYRINTEAMTELEDWTQSVRRRWNRRLDALDAVLREEKQKSAQSPKQEEKNE